jgi:catechol 2,3-dioxygenase-like lactoylglutathione lyase family enzyme
MREPLRQRDLPTPRQEEQAMAIHHIAFATRDVEATHRFYTEAMGFDLARVEAIPTENEGGWAKHLFYDTGDGMIAFWDLHDDGLPDFDPALSTSQGLPVWINHLAFHAEDEAAFQKALDRWLAFGIDVAEIDHGWCRSIYATDPNGTLVEWCMDTAELTEADRAKAREVLADPNPELVEGKEPQFHLAAGE